MDTYNFAVSEDRTKVTSKQPMANPPTKKPAAYPILQRLLNRKSKYIVYIIIIIMLHVHELPACMHYLL